MGLLLHLTCRLFAAPMRVAVSIAGGLPSLNHRNILFSCCEHGLRVL